MSTVIWQGGATPVAQVNTVTVGGTPATSQVYTVTIAGKDVAYTALVTDTNATIAAALQAALAASTVPEFSEITWANPSAGVVTGTANNAGKPFTNTSGATGTGTLVTAIAMASAGPNDWSTASNWSTGVVPVSTDTVSISGNVPIMYGLAQADSAVALTTLNSLGGMNADIGLPNFDVAGGYYQYRPTYLAISATTVNIGQGYGAGAGRIRLDLGTGASTVNVYATGQAAQDPNNLPALCLKGSNAANVLNVYQGSIGVAVEAGQTAQYATVRLGYATSQQSDVALTIGAGATVATINQDGGNLLLLAGATTLNLYGGKATLQGTGALTTLSAVPGTRAGCSFRYLSTGTLGTVTLANKATLDASGDLRAKTITNMTVGSGATVTDPDKTITFTNPFVLQNCGFEDVELVLGKGLTVQRT